MKNWDTLEADVNKIMNKHFTAGRGGKRIDKVVIHHNGGNLTIEGCWQVWQTRQASAQYQVERSGRIGQLVWDGDTAWHAGNRAVNQTSIGIEHANGSGTTGNLTAATLEEGAHLVAALCKKYGLGRPQWKKNVFPHQHFTATGCPGPLREGGLQHAQYMKRAGEWYDAMTGTTPKPPAPESKPPVTSAPALRRGSTGAAVKALQTGLLRAFPSYAAPIKAGGGPNTTFGPATEKVVREFQRRVGIPQDGIVGPVTRQHLARYGVTF